MLLFSHDKPLNGILYMKKNIFIFLAFFLVLFFWSSSELIAQCAICKAVVKAGSEDNAASVGTTLNSAILYLMSIPYILAGIGGYFWWKNNRAEKNQATSSF